MGHWRGAPDLESQLSRATLGATRNLRLLARQHGAPALRVPGAAPLGPGAPAGARELELVGDHRLTSRVEHLTPKVYELSEFLVDVLGYAPQGLRLDAVTLAAIEARFAGAPALFRIPAFLPDADVPEIARAAVQETNWTYAVPVYMDDADCAAFVRRMLPVAV